MRPASEVRAAGARLLTAGARLLTASARAPAARARLLATSALLLAGCPYLPTDSSCDQHVAGDATQPIRAEAITVEGGTARTVNPGDTLTLRQPPQGGYILFGGVRATNLRACNVHLTAQVLDVDGGHPISPGLDGRDADLTEQRGDLFEPREANLATQVPNVPGCPDPMGGGLSHRAGVLQVQIRDADGKQGEVRVPVQIECPAGDAFCAKACAAADGG